MIPKTLNELNTLWFAGKSAIGCHDFQRRYTEASRRPILNAACAGDPANLGDFDAINMDIQTNEPWTGRNFAASRNFIPGSVFNIPFGDSHFGTVVLGEFLEHCDFNNALTAILECKRVLAPMGTLILTIPLDARPRAEQQAYHPASLPPPPDEYCPGVASYHKTYWSNEQLNNLFEAAGLSEIFRQPLLYYLTAPVGGWGIILIKPN